MDEQEKIIGVHSGKCFFAADPRGSFHKIFSLTGVDFPIFKEAYLSISHANVIRGMHFQAPPYAVDKLVTILSGTALDVIFDMRKNSPTYRQIASFILREEEHSFVFIPAGCAHGFLAYEDHTTLLYHITQPYAPAFDSGIRFDSFEFQWPLSEQPILSERDLLMPPFNESNNPF